MRILSEDGGTKYWSAVYLDKICVVISIEADQTVGAGCATADQFKAGGAATRLLTQGSASEAYLLPDLAAKAAGTQLVLVDPFDEEREAADISSGTFKLNKIPAVSPDDVPTGFGLADSK